MIDKDMSCVCCDEKNKKRIIAWPLFPVLSEVQLFLMYCASYTLKFLHHSCFFIISSTLVTHKMGVNSLWNAGVVVISLTFSLTRLT